MTKKEDYGYEFLKGIIVGIFVGILMLAMIILFNLDDFIRDNNLMYKSDCNNSVEIMKFNNSNTITFQGDTWDCLDISLNHCVRVGGEK